MADNADNLPEIIESRLKDLALLIGYAYDDDANIDNWVMVHEWLRKCFALVLGEEVWPKVLAYAKAEADYLERLGLDGEATDELATRRLAQSAEGRDVAYLQVRQYLGLDPWMPETEVDRRLRVGLEPAAAADR